MDNVESRKNLLIKKLSSFKEWDDRYRQILFYAKKLDDFPENEKNDDLLVPGCQSRVWLKMEYIDEKVIFMADADALIAKGIVALLVYLYNNSYPKEILDNPPDFFKEIGISDHLSMSRRNGLSNMVKKITDFARSVS